MKKQSYKERRKEKRTEEKEEERKEKPGQGAGPDPPKPFWLWRWNLTRPVGPKGLRTRTPNTRNTRRESDFNKQNVEVR